MDITIDFKNVEKKSQMFSFELTCFKLLEEGRLLARTKEGRDLIIDLKQYQAQITIDPIVSEVIEDGVWEE